MYKNHYKFYPHQKYRFLADILGNNKYSYVYFFVKKKHDGNMTIFFNNEVVKVKLFYIRDNNKLIECFTINNISVYADMVEIKE